MIIGTFFVKLLLHEDIADNACLFTEKILIVSQNIFLMSFSWVTSVLKVLVVIFEILLRVKSISTIAIKALLKSFPLVENACE